MSRDSADFNNIDTRTEEGKMAFFRAVDAFNAQSLAWQRRYFALRDYVEVTARKFYDLGPQYRGKWVTGIMTDSGVAACVTDNRPRNGVDYDALERVRQKHVDESNPRSTGEYAVQELWISDDLVEKE